MPAVAIIPFIFEAVSFAGFAAGGLAAIGATAAADIIGSTIVAGAIDGAILGAGGGALTAAIEGKNVLRGAETGAISGGISGGVAPVLSGVLGLNPSSTGALAALERGGVRGVSNELGSIGAGLANGQNFGRAAQGGLAGALGSGIATGLVSGAQGGGPVTGEAGLGASGLAYGLSSLLSPALSPKGNTTGSQSVQVAGAPQPLVAPAQQGTSSALGSSLFSSPTLGYSPSAPILGGGDSASKSTRNPWSSEDKSLRDVGSTVT